MWLLNLFLAANKCLFPLRCMRFVFSGKGDVKAAVEQVYGFQASWWRFWRKPAAAETAWNQLWHELQGATLNQVPRGCSKLNTTQVSRCKGLTGGISLTFLLDYAVMIVCSNSRCFCRGLCVRRLRSFELFLAAERVALIPVPWLRSGS